MSVALDPYFLRGKHQMSKIVLCVDDSVTMQMVADITFRGTDLTYVGARSVDEAMEKLKGAKPSLILADAQMPGKSGYELCQSIKSDAKFADVPVAILVGNSAPYDAGKGAAAGVDANITKPWDTAVMLKTCQDLVAAGSTARPGGAGAGAATAAATAAPTPRAATANPAPVAAVKPVAAAANQPPRSATIMGMPTIKVPAGGVAPAVAPPASSRTTVMAVPPVSASGGMVAPAVAIAPVAAAAPAAAAAAPARAPMVAGTPTKRSALVERTLAKMAAQLAEATGLQPGSPELLALLKLSTEVVERIVWEVVPELAEQISRENLHDLAAKRS